MKPKQKPQKLIAIALLLATLITFIAILLIPNAAAQLLPVAIVLLVIQVLWFITAL